MFQKNAILATVLCAVVSPLAVAQKVTADQLFALGFEPGQKGAFEEGEVISSGFKELSDTELALVMAVMVPAPMDKVVEFSRSGESMNVNKDILDQGMLQVDDI